MIVKMSGTGQGVRSGIDLLFLHTACFLLVVAYVNMFDFWAWLSKQLGPGLPLELLPIIVTLVVLLGISFRFVQRARSGYRVSYVFLVLGVVIAFLALALPDSQLPGKRIHVAEYIILSFLVRYTLSHRLEGLRLTVFTALATALYGVHDEMLQGLHSQRYFGWLDIIVNSVAGVSGAMLGQGLACFVTTGEGGSAKSKKALSAARILLFSVLLAAVVWQVIYLYQHRGDAVLYPAMIPVTVCSGIIVFLCPEVVFSTKTHGLQVVFWLTLGLVVYPVLAGLNGLEFH